MILKNMIQCIDNIFIFFNDCFSYLLFTKQFKCCGLANGAADWGKNFQEYSKSCECPATSDMSDSYCTLYDHKKVYKQVRTNQIWHRK